MHTIPATVINNPIIATSQVHPTPPIMVLAAPSGEARGGGGQMLNGGKALGGGEALGREKSCLSDGAAARDKGRGGGLGGDNRNREGGEGPAPPESKAAAVAQAQLEVLIRREIENRPNTRWVALEVNRRAPRQEIGAEKRLSEDPGTSVTLASGSHSSNATRTRMTSADMSASETQPCSGHSAIAKRDWVGREGLAREREAVVRD
eukprot:scaffold181327_cov32-Tisochrysis_lutea.AAC.1